MTESGRKSPSDAEDRGRLRRPIDWVVACRRGRAGSLDPPPPPVEAIERVGVALRPLSTPSGGGYRSINLTLRQRLAY